MQFVMATHNPKKLQEMQRILEPLSITLVTAALPEVEETGTTFAENAYLKARSACEATGLPAIADDSGLAVDALDGAPGVYSARYGGALCKTDADRVQYLLRELAEVPADRRSARFVCSICCVFPDGTVLRAEDICEGTIGDTPMGENGFGYDPVFLRPDGRSFAQYSASEKDAISHRGKAMRRFFALLQNKQQR